MSSQLYSAQDALIGGLLSQFVTHCCSDEAQTLRSAPCAATGPLYAAYAA